MSEPTQEQFEALLDFVSSRDFSNAFSDLYEGDGKPMGNLLAQREAAAKAEGVREGIEMVAKMVEVRGASYPQKLMWQGLAKDIRNLLREGGE